MRRKRGQKGFTLIELLIVIAIIGILAAIAVPIYRAQTMKARLSELTNSISTVATAAKLYYEENGSFNWPSGATISTLPGFQNTLGVSVPMGAGTYINAAQITHSTGIITFTAQGISSEIDTNTIVLTPDATGGGIKWAYSGTVPAPYLPKK